MLLTEFDEKLYRKNVWKDGFSEGEQSGFVKGEQSGFVKGQNIILSIMDEIKKGNDTIDKLTAMGYDPELVKQILDRK